MTVLSELSKIAYIGSSSQTLYPIPFEYINTDDVKVSIYTSNNEFVENWTYSVQYVIEGGNVKVLSGYNIDNTKKLLILRMVDLVQDNKYREGGDFPAKSTETSFDKLTMITQQLQETLDRCVKVEVLDNQTPEELLQTVYDKLDSATEIAGDAINAANQAQTAADNATAAVTSAEQTLVQTQAYVDSAKVDINNTKNTAINTINSTVSTAKGDITNTANNATSNITSTVTQAKTDINAAIDEATMNISNTSTSAINTINTAVSNAESNISTIVSDAEGSITNIAVTEANKAIANAAQEATDTAKANVNSYVDGTVKPSLQTYVDQAQEDANSAATSMEQAALSATAASNYASNASADADNAAESAGLAANSATAAKVSETNAKASETNALIWAEGTDAQVQALGGEKSAKGWAEASTAVNYTNITNCITEIPQDIKLELNNGTLTLKAGSKVYVPNGFESDGTTPKFDVKIIGQDLTVTFDNTIQKGVIISPNNTMDHGNLAYHFISSSTAPSISWGFWYDLTNNQIKWTNNGSTWISGYSLPICIATGTNGSVTSIDQVFNGFGYIGSTVFALPGVKGLIPNGRNDDGSLKNVEFSYTSVKTYTVSGTNTYYIRCADNYLNAFQLSTYYDEVNNYNIWNNIKQPMAICGRFSFVDNKVTSLTPKTAFHAVDWNDIEDKLNHLNNPFSLLDYKWSEYELNNASWLLSNGAFNSGTVYKSVYELLLKIKNGTETKDGVSVKLSTEAYTDTDFVINTADTTFRLPVKVKLASGNAVVGNGKTLGLFDNVNTAGLANIASTYVFLEAVGRAYNTNIGTAMNVSEEPIAYGRTVGVTTDATKSGIETSSNGLKLYFYVGETIQDANLIDAGRIGEQLANKVDTSNTQWATNACMPDYSAGIAKVWNKNISTTKNVRICYGGSSQNQAADAIKLYINNNLIGNYIIASSGFFMQWADIPAGATYKVTGGQTGTYIIEYPLKGAK